MSDKLNISLEHINKIFNSGETLYKVRNEIKKIELVINGKKEFYSVKKFKNPGFLKSVIYSKTFSKAKKSYINAKFLFDNKVGVSEPVCFLENFQINRLKESYYIEKFIPDFSDFKQEMINILEIEPDCHKFLALLKPVAEEIRKMHDSGFVHNDLGYQNIAVKRLDENTWGEVKFIDLNRGKIRQKLSMKERASDIAKIEIPSDLRRIFFYMYFRDNIPDTNFLKWEKIYRKRITLHNESRKYRHPVRHIKSIISPYKGVGKERMHYKNMWLWDEKSGQPAVILTSEDRKKYRKKTEIFGLIYHNIKKIFSLRKNYKKLENIIFKKQIDIYSKAGLCVEFENNNFKEKIDLLDELQVFTIFIRIYHHKGKEHLDFISDIIKLLYEKGYEVNIGLVQYRKSVLNIESWVEFVETVLEKNHNYLKYVEVGHALNRVKWGVWNFKEIQQLYGSVSNILDKYDNLQILAPAVNDFEFYFAMPVLTKISKKNNINGFSSHLYVDRRGAPENYQGKFSLLEKCIIGKAVSASFNLKAGFFITETNWPIKNTGIYSPIGCPYIAPGITENPIHVSEENYAAYMLRYYVIALCSGMVEKVWWWRLAAHGFGICDDKHGIKKRPAFFALKFFISKSKNSKFLKYEKKQNIHFYYFEKFLMLYTEKQSIEYFLSLSERKITEIFNMYGEKEKLAEKITVSENPVYLIF